MLDIILKKSIHPFIFQASDIIYLFDTFRDDITTPCNREGQQQIKDILQGGMEAHAEYGTFLWTDGAAGTEERIVAHMDGERTIII